MLKFIDKIRGFFTTRNTTLSNLIQKELESSKAEMSEYDYRVDISYFYNDKTFFNILKKFKIEHKISASMGQSRVSIVCFLCLKTQQDVEKVKSVINYLQICYNTTKHQYNLDLYLDLYHIDEIEILKKLGFSNQFNKKFYAMDDINNIYYELIPCNDKKYRLDISTLKYSYQYAHYGYHEKGEFIKSIRSETNEDLYSFVSHNLKYFEISINEHTT